MTLQTGLQQEPRRTQDARQRSDELNREYVGASGKHTNNQSPVKNVVPGSEQRDIATNDKLLNLLEKSVQTLRHTSENVENRGLKFVLKVMAQERAEMLRMLRHEFGEELMDPLDPSQKSSATRLQEGLQDFQSSMTVQRQGRENVALGHLVDEEERLLAAYDEAWQENAAPLRLVLDAQREQVAQLLARLQSVGEGLDPIVARVFDTRIEGESAVTRLRERGIDASQIDVAPINVIASPVVETAVATAGPRNAIAAGAFGGAIVGAVIGLVLAAFVWFSPQSVQWIAISPLTLFLLATVVFAVFGIVFGLFIGQNKREDDLAVTVDGLINGEILVAVYAQPHQIPMVEDVLQIHHARELNR